ncbi:MAG: DUF177 domain-containing protein [Alphaproteobacteria bacterium]
MQNVFYHPIIVDDLRNAEKKFNIKTSGNQNKFIAEVLKVAGIDELKAEIFIKANNNIIKVKGNIKTVVELTSVVSLEKFKKDYDVNFDMIFDTSLNYQQQRELENEGKEAPDIIIEGKIDLADIIIEQLALNIEEYPRIDGEEFVF